MKLTADRGELLLALGHASSIVEAGRAMPVLSNVLLETADEGLRIVTTNLNLQIALNVPATLEGEGATTVSARLLHSIVRELPDGVQIKLELDGDRLKVTGGRSRFSLQTMPRADFPVMEVKNATATFELPAADMLKMFGRIATFQSSDPIVRPYLCGISIDVEDDQLVFAAMDGNRIGWAKLPAPEGAKIEGAILSAKLIGVLARLLDGRKDNACLTFETNKVTIEVGDAVLTGKLVEGAYPPWRRIIPTTNDKRLRIDADAFEAAVKRAALINDRRSLVKLSLEADKLTISATSEVHGDVTEEVPCAWSGEPHITGFNSRFLLDLIASADADELEVMFGDEPSPPLFFNPNDDSARWIVPPMRV